MSPTPPSAEPESAKRFVDQALDSVQLGNRRWWTNHPMSYDWHGKIRNQPFTQEWFDAIDERFTRSARLFATFVEPFDRILPTSQVRGADVLEIGCGMGLHTEIFTRLGANVTSVDLTPTGVEATRKRLDLKGLSARVMQGDAEQLPFGDESFDFVWSWGVIHHSARTARIVRQIARVLRPNGSCRVMVYNREGMSARVAFVRDHLLRGKFLRQSFDETLWQSTDGFTARHYVREQFEDLFRAFFQDVTSEICGQESDAVPLPAMLRHTAARLLSDDYLKRAQAKRGSFIFLKAARPT